ncbi:MAG: TIGR03067 domain-containing protein [Gemmatales bacterium]|nr:TIGR03067 domain-containing protein [Gemmatales bacterium]MDW8386211.1 TIGR03067 domain-containing protein [Gemmatales bacterium]
MLRVLTGLLLAVCVGGAVADDQAVQKELEKFQGHWIIESVEEKGRKLSSEEIGDNRLTFTRDKYVQTFNKQMVEEGSIKLDLSRKPAWIDLVITSGSDKGKTQLGIYEFVGETLRICTARPGEGERPASFDGQKHIIFTLKRDKK